MSYRAGEAVLRVVVVFGGGGGGGGSDGGGGGGRCKRKPVRGRGKGERKAC